ncbi:MAG: hypothetical protein AAF899_11725 [Pseudomonadota bacterium]
MDGLPNPRLLPLLGLVMLVLLTGCKTDVLHSIEEPEAARILSVLHNHGIEADKALDDPEKNLWRVSVPQKSAGRAFALLNEYKLPASNDRRLRDVFGQNKLVMTPIEEQALFLEALQGEIAHTLEAVDGVIDARVHLVKPQHDLRGRPTTEAKASVVIEYQPTMQGVEPMTNDEIRGLVANAVAELSPDGVTVVQKAASIASPAANMVPTDVNLVSIGPLVIEESSLTSLKLMIVVTVLLVAGLGMGVFWQSRLIEQLREELKAERTDLVRLDDVDGMTA